MATATQKWLNSHEAAERLGFSEKTLANWRYEGRGPRYSKVGRSIRYLAADLDTFMKGLGVMTDAA